MLNADSVLPKILEYVLSLSIVHFRTERPLPVPVGAVASKVNSDYSITLFLGSPSSSILLETALFGIILRTMPQYGETILAGAIYRDGMWLACAVMTSGLTPTLFVLNRCTILRCELIFVHIVGAITNIM